MVVFFQRIELLFGVAKRSLDPKRDPVVLRVSMTSMPQLKLYLLEDNLGEHVKPIRKLIINDIFISEDYFAQTNSKVNSWSIRFTEPNVSNYQILLFPANLSKKFCSL